VRTFSCLLLVLALVAALPDYVAGQTADSTTEQPATSRHVPDPRTALLLGLIPGGGQLYNGKWLKALIVMAVEGYYIYLFQQNRDFYNHYDESLPLSRDRYLEERNKFAWRFVFVYILGLMDGYVDAHLSTFPPDTSYQAQPLPPSNQSIEESP